jgi:DNA-binding response OmpR family regulator
MAYDISQVRFLIIEDNPALATLFRSLLTGLAVKHIAVVSNGETGKQLAKSFKPDIIITDYKMSPTTGIDSTKWLRTSPESPDQDVAVIMTSAYSEIERVMMSRDAGVNKFLVKPVTVHTLYQRIRTIIESDRPFVRAEEYAGPCRRRNRRTQYDGPQRRMDDAAAASIAMVDGPEMAEIAI